MNATDAILRVLNSAVDADASAIAKLVNHRVGCTAELGNHPTIQCQAVATPDASDTAIVGMLGIINGIAAELDADLICAEFDGEKLVRFTKYPSATAVVPSIEQRMDAASQGAEAVVIDGAVRYRKLDRE